MKLSMPTFAAVLISLSAAAQSAPDTYMLGHHLGVIEGWRIAPEAVTHHCKKFDPEGDDSRNASLLAWQQAHAELIAKIDASFAKAVPIVSPSRTVDPVQGIRAYITIEALKMRFLGKTDDEARAVCKTYFAEPARTNVEPVIKSLAEIDRWLQTQK